MCILFYTVSQPGYRLILASNRDEYFDRQALPAHWHTFEDPNAFSASSNENVEELDEPEPWVLSGRDLGNPVGGTWLGMTRDLRIGIIAAAPSRGLLLKSFLSPSPSDNLPSVQQHLAGHQVSVDEYEGFNLLLLKFPTSHNSREPEIGYLSNRPSPIFKDLGKRGEEGDLGDDVKACLGLSNTPLSEPWPKVLEGERRMQESLADWSNKGESDADLVTRMMELLEQSIPLKSLADAAKCTCLQPVLVGKNPALPLTDRSEGRWYGTRVSTVILVKDNDEVIFVERDIGEADGVGGARKGSGERRFPFSASTAALEAG